MLPAFSCAQPGNVYLAAAPNTQPEPVANALRADCSVNRAAAAAAAAAAATQQQHPPPHP
eukprot:4032839-Alexandrium_andersonii.AAC.1